MEDMRKHLEKMLVQAAECDLIRDLASDPKKRELFDRLARHHRELARQIELAIISRSAADSLPSCKAQGASPAEDE